MKRALLILLTAAIGYSADWIAAMEQAQNAMRRGELVNAEQILNSTIDQIQLKSGHSATALDEPLEMLAQVYQREKRYAEAVSIEQQRLEIWTAFAGENGVIVARALQQLSTAQRQAGNLPDAESSSRRALAILTAAFIDKPPSAQAAADLADILVAENRNDEADQMFALAEKTFETALGPTSFLAMGVKERRAKMLKQAAPVAPATVYRVGQNQVTAPRILSKVEPQYAEEARKGKLQGTVSMSLVIDSTGAPTQIAVLRPLGMGLDEKAIEAVSQWRFSPGTKNGTPVPVFTQVEVTFHLL